MQLLLLEANDQMNYYRIVFAGDEILYCDDLINQIISDFPTLQENKGQIIFALVKATSVEDATRKAANLKDNLRNTHRQPL